MDLHHRSDDLPRCPQYEAILDSTALIHSASGRILVQLVKWLSLLRLQTILLIEVLYTVFHKIGTPLYFFR